MATQLNKSIWALMFRYKFAFHLSWLTMWTRVCIVSCWNPAGDVSWAHYQRMSESLTDIQDNTFKMHWFNVNLMTIFYSIKEYCGATAQYVLGKCYLEKGKSIDKFEKLCGLFEGAHGGKRIRSNSINWTSSPGEIGLRVTEASSTCNW